MTWRAFIIGLVAVAAIAALTPYNDYDWGNTYLTGNHFPPGAFFILLVLTLGLNVVLKWLKKAWALRRSELMLVWCMMIAAATVPASGLMRLWFPMLAAPGYHAQSAELPDQQMVLEQTPDSVLLAKDPRAIPIENFYEGYPEGEPLRLFWSEWARPIATWLVFILLFYLATFFVGGLLRRQWVNVERLIFPLARVPLDLTEGSGGADFLPALVKHKAFLSGVVLTLLFGLIRMAPALFGAAQGWQPVFPVQALLWDTPLAQSSMGNAYVYPLALGIAFLVPADVALSIWFFFFFTRAELQVSHWMGVPIEGGSYGDWMRWQQAGAFIVFFLMMLWAARRHLLGVVKKAFWREGAPDDSEEPIPYRVGFWGLMLAVIGMVAWFVYFDTPVWTALLLIFLIMCVMVIHARLVCQGGVFFTQHNWRVPNFLHSVSGGEAFTSSAAVVAMMQNAILLQDSREILSGHVMNALRISSVFEKHRRWFMPVLLTAIGLALVVSGYFTMRVYYDIGALNSTNAWGVQALPQQTFKTAARMIKDPAGSAEPMYGPFSLGAGVMFFLTLMRGHFYWWPVHSLGFLIGSTWPAYNLWFSFLLAWAAKVFIMKIAGGSVLRKARRFFLGVIIGEAVVIAVSTLLYPAGITVGNLFMPH